MIHTLVFIGVNFVILVLELIYVAIWVLIFCKLTDYDFDETLSKVLIALLVVFTMLFSQYLTDKIIEENNIGVVFETVSENGGE